jgi:hypothetical protein
MKTPLNSRRGRLAALFSIFAGLALGSTGSAATEKSGCGGCCAAVASTVAAADDYPLTTCVVSGEKLGSMGAPVEHVHKQEGKPDRLVRFCCKACIKDFTQDPEKYLKMIDDAAAIKAKGGQAGHGA